MPELADIADLNPLCRDGDILLRRYTANDAPALCATVQTSLESLSYWFPWCHAGYSFADAEGWINRCVLAWAARSEFPLGIFAADNATVLGGVGLSQLNRADRVANLGYWVAEPHRGRGIATRAARSMALLGLGELGFSRLEIVVHPDNAASLRVAEKLGAVRESLARNRLQFQGRPTDAVVYSLIATDLERKL